MENNSCNTELEKYIWLSFHEKDRPSVRAVVQQMERDGVSVMGGKSFDALQAKPSVCLVFLSEAYLNDQNCRMELDRIRMERIPYLIIYLEDLELPQSLAMRIGRSRALFYHKYSHVKDLCGEIYEAHEIGAYDPERVARRNTELFRKHRKKQIIQGLCVVCIALVLLGGAALRFDVFGRSNGTHPSDSFQESSVRDPSVILDTEDFYVRINQYQYFDSLGAWVLQLQLENHTDDTVVFTTGHETINGMTVRTAAKGYNRPDGEYAWSQELAPGGSKVCRVEYPALLWKQSDADCVMVHQGTFQVKSGDGQLLAEQAFALYPEGEKAAQSFAGTAISDASVIFEDEVLLVAYFGRQVSDRGGGTADLFYLQNHSPHSCDAALFATGDGSDETYFSLKVLLQPNERILIPAYWSDAVGAEATVQMYYKTEQMEWAFTSDEIPVLRNID